MLPVRRSTSDALERYLRDPLRKVGRTPSDPIFVSGRHRRLAYPTAAAGLQDALDRTDTPPAERPRPHDFRHTFTVRTVASWYVSGRGVSQLLPALSTYLGHVSVENTRIYLRANALLLEHARRLFEQRAAAVWRELS
ncbi:MAG: integrase/recombinase XerD [Myxococcota bacterium]